MKQSGCFPPDSYGFGAPLVVMCFCRHIICPDQNILILQGIYKVMDCPKSQKVDGYLGLTFGSTSLCWISGESGTPVGKTGIHEKLYFSDHMIGLHLRQVVQSGPPKQAGPQLLLEVVAPFCDVSAQLHPGMKSKPLQLSSMETCPTEYAPAGYHHF